MSDNLLIDVVPFKPVILENKTTGKDIFEVTGVLQRANVKNHNGRVYSKYVLSRECENYLKEFVEVGNAYGELDHPDSTVVSLKNASHIVKELWWKGDDLYGRLQLLGTPSGNIVKEILKDGHTIGISSRGTGSVKQSGNGVLEVGEDFKLICWDFVSNPSTHGAFMSKVVNENRLDIEEDRSNRIHSVIREILCQTNECYCEL